MDFLKAGYLQSNESGAVTLGEEADTILSREMTRYLQFASLRRKKLKIRSRGGAESARTAFTYEVY